MSFKKENAAAARWPMKCGGKRSMCKVTAVILHNIEFEVRTKGGKASSKVLIVSTQLSD